MVIYETTCRTRVHVCMCADARVCVCVLMRDKSIKSSYKHLGVAFI